MVRLLIHRASRLPGGGLPAQIHQLAHGSFELLELATGPQAVANAAGRLGDAVKAVEARRSFELVRQFE
jgi:hypothetical protein